MFYFPLNLRAWLLSSHLSYMFTYRKTAPKWRVSLILEMQLHSRGFSLRKSSKGQEPNWGKVKIQQFQTKTKRQSSISGVLIGYCEIQDAVIGPRTIDLFLKIQSTQKIQKHNDVCKIIYKQIHTKFLQRLVVHVSLIFLLLYTVSFLHQQTSLSSLWTFVYLYFLTTWTFCSMMEKKSICQIFTSAKIGNISLVLFTSKINVYTQCLKVILLSLPEILSNSRDIQVFLQKTVLQMDLKS